MNKKDLVMLIMAKRTLDYQKDPDPENWRTIKGAHVHVDNEGKIDGGAGGKFNGKGALPRSMFSGTGKQTEFAEVTEKKKEIAERVQKEKETQKAERRKQQAAARKQQKAEQEAKQRKEREDWYWEDKPESKPTAKGSAAQNLIDYIKEQTNIDLSQHRNTEREKRGQLLVNWKELDRNQQFAIQTLAQKGKFELIDNGGYGYILKPTKEPKLGAPKPEEKEDKNSWRAKLGKEKYDELMEKVTSNKTWAEKLKSSMGEKRFNEAMKKSLENAKKLPAEEPKTSAPKEPKMKATQNETPLQRMKRWNSMHVDGMKKVENSNGKYTAIETTYPNGEKRVQYYESGRWTNARPKGLAESHGKWRYNPLKVEIKE